jgi:hypothetical protein
MTGRILLPAHCRTRVTTGDMRVGERKQDFGDFGVRASGGWVFGRLCVGVEVGAGCGPRIERLDTRVVFPA